MKKFLAYSLIATVVIVTLGVLFIFGMFDLNLGQTNSTAIGSNSYDSVKVHNELVDTIHVIALNSEVLNSEFNVFTPESNIQILKDKINILTYNKDKLMSFFDNKQFTEKQTKTTEFLQNTYLPAIENVLNTFLKAITYFEEKEFTQESIDSFKNIIESNEKQLEEAHNNFIDELNTHKHY